MPNRTRYKRIAIDATEEEKEIIKEKAKAVNMNVGEYARRMMINGQVTNIDLSPLKDLSGELGRIGNNVNQIARKANQGGEVTNDEIQQVLNALGEIWRLQKSTLSSLRLISR